MSLAGWLNTAWMLKCAGEAAAFRRATRTVAQTQADLLADILRTNQDTAVGRAHAFSRIRSPRDYQERVPLSVYEDYQDAIARIAAGEAGELTQERVERLQPTSGTTGGEKLIPCTRALRRQFQRAVSAWVADLFGGRPALRGGRAYWSISPALGRPRRTGSGIPIGFDDDSAYLGGLERWLLERLLVVPPAVARLADLETFRYCTLWRLLAAEDLALVSVWSPTFLTALLAPLPEWQDRLCFDLRRGTLSPPGPLPAEVARLLALPAASRRASELEAIFRSRRSLPEKLRLTWPRLALISCWADAAAARCLEEVRELFPGVEVQPKGLLATEGCITFPLLGRPAPVLAIRSHFFEFPEVDGAGKSAACRLAHELDRGGRYRVVLTTAGGLYRYHLRDEVEVAGFENRCPLLRFLGRSDSTSDLVGEKLSEPHVRAVIDRVFAGLGLTLRFALLVPLEGRPARYRLHVQGPAIYPDPSLEAELAARVQAGLEENPHYAYAVRLGQLAPVEVRVLDPGGESGWRVYERRCLAQGQKLGDIKPAALDPRPGWGEEFRRESPEPPSANSPSGFPPVPVQTP